MHSHKEKLEGDPNRAKHQRDYRRLDCNRLEEVRSGSQDLADSNRNFSTHGGGGESAECMLIYVHVVSLGCNKHIVSGETCRLDQLPVRSSADAFAS